MKRLSFVSHRLSSLRSVALTATLAFAVALSSDAIGQNNPSIGTSGSVLGDDVLYTIGAAAPSRWGRV